MSDRIEPPVILRFPGRAPDELDRLLRDFFRAELPEPWPAWAPPEAQADRPKPAGRPRWPAVRRRLVLAASVALLLVGYLTLARAFPGTSEQGGPAVSDQNTMGKLPAVPKGDIHKLLPEHPQPRTVPVPNGGRARMWEQQLPDRSIRMQLQLLPDAPGRR
jgi:anti-sigma factor RsiW